MTRDAESFRDIRVTFLVEMDNDLQGPAAALLCPGLPLPGSAWALNGGLEFDDWAFCRWDATVNPVVTNEPFNMFEVELLFSTRPPGVRPGHGGSGGGNPGQGGPKDSSVCRDQQVGDPLLEPQKVSGSFVRYQEEAAFDMYGVPVLNSAFERLRGKEVEFDSSRMQIKIEQNVADLELPLLALLHNTVNGLPLWGLNPRCIKLSDITWDKKYYGSCYAYYTRQFTFDIRYDGFDKLVADEGSKVLNGHWSPTTGNYVTDAITGYTGSPNPNPFNPAHFKKFQDRNQNNMRGMLNGAGLPADVTVGSADVRNYVMYRANPARGVALTRSDTWFVINTVTPAAWSNSTNYKTGDVITYNGYTYIAAGSSLNVTPPVQSPSPTAQWIPLPNGATLAAAGTWNKNNTYLTGMYVSQPASMYHTAIGMIFVQKYLESDFEVLGIPLDF